MHMDVVAAWVEHLDTSVHRAGMVELGYTKEALRHMLVCRKVRMIVGYTFQAASQRTDAGHKYAGRMADCHIWVHNSHAHICAVSFHKYLKLVAAHSYYNSPDQVLKLEQIQAMYLMVGCWRHGHLGYSNHSRLAVGEQLYAYVDPSLIHMCLLLGVAENSRRRFEDIELSGECIRSADDHSQQSVELVLLGEDPIELREKVPEADGMCWSWMMAV